MKCLILLSAAGYILFFIIIWLFEENSDTFERVVTFVIVVLFSDLLALSRQCDSIFFMGEGGVGVGWGGGWKANPHQF